MKLSLTLVAFLLCLCYVSCASRSIQSVTYYSENNFKFNVKDYENGVAVGEFINSQQEDGWMKLNVSTNPKFSDAEQSFAVGFVEGLLTHFQIYELFQNQIYNWNFTKTVNDIQIGNYYYPKKLVDFFREHISYLEENINLNKQNKYWNQVNLILKQFNGLVKGYIYMQNKDNRIVKDKYLDWIDLFILQSSGDMYTLIDVFKNHNNNTLTQLNNKYNIPNHIWTSSAFQKKLKDEEPPYTECSALIKLTPDCKDIFIGHTTWRSYNIMNKMYKSVYLPLKDVSSKKITFSSSASFFSSKEDYLVLENGLVVMETSLSLFNQTALQNVKPTTVLCWMRSVIASRLAYTAKEWTNYFSMYSSGTYGNQWMALDYKLFTPGKCELPSNTLWIIEELPGYYKSQDVTPIVNKQSYWPSYNIPFFKEVYDLCGYPEAKIKFGNEMDYNKCPRAKIFKREQAKIINDWKSFGRVLQFNEWQTDPESLGDPAKSIASRYDLREKNPAAFGGIDTKLTFYEKVMKEASSFGRSGPTHQDQTPFTWKDSKWQNIPHAGQPDTYDFDFVDLNM